MSELLPKRFTDAETARAYLEALQWPEGPICPHCGTVNRASAIKGGRKGLYFCNSCREQFSVTVGTVFERSHVPLNLWLYATHLLCSSKKGISSHQLSRMLGVTYKTAWFMAHRIRAAMTPITPDPLGGEGKVVEADETYIGKADGKRKGLKAGGYSHKMKVLSLVERGGEVRSMKIKDATKLEIVDIIRTHVDPASTLHTDGAGFYKQTGAVKRHEAVDHNKQYVRKGRAGKVHTNTLEGFFSVFKRGMVGTYQHCGEQHLNLYLSEFDFRANNRIAFGIDDAMRTDKALEGITGKRMTYRRTN